MTFIYKVVISSVQRGYKGDENKTFFQYVKMVSAQEFTSFYVCKKNVRNQVHRNPYINEFLSQKHVSGHSRENYQRTLFRIIS